MGTKNYKESEVVDYLSKKRDLKLIGKKIWEVRDSSEIGNSTKGKIDFLVRYCGYERIVVSSL